MHEGSHTHIADIRVVAIINKGIESGRTMNALLHLGVGLMAKLDASERDQLSFLDFRDQDGQIYPSISARSFIVLRGSSSDIATARLACSAAGLPNVCFIQTMTDGSYIEQLTRTQSTPTAEVVFFGVAMFGSRTALAPITKRLSLWR